MRTTPISAECYIQLLTSKIDCILNRRTNSVDISYINLLRNKILQTRHLQLFSRLPKQIRITSEVFLDDAKGVKIRNIDSIYLVTDAVHDEVVKLQTDLCVVYCTVENDISNIILDMSECVIHGRVSPFIIGRNLLENAQFALKRNTSEFLRGETILGVFDINWHFIQSKIPT